MAQLSHGINGKAQRAQDEVDRAGEGSYNDADLRLGFPEHNPSTPEGRIEAYGLFARGLRRRLDHDPRASRLLFIAMCVVCVGLFVGAFIAFGH